MDTTLFVGSRRLPHQHKRVTVAVPDALHPAATHAIFHQLLLYAVAMLVGSALSQWPAHLHHGLVSVWATKVQQCSNVVLLKAWLTENQAWLALRVLSGAHHLQGNPPNMNCTCVSCLTESGLNSCQRLVKGQQLLKAR
jgi:hypothetical protein